MTHKDKEILDIIDGTETEEELQSLAGIVLAAEDFKTWFEQNEPTYKAEYESNAREWAFEKYDRKIKDLSSFEYEEVILDMLSRAVSTYNDEVGDGNIDEAKALDEACGLMDGWGFYGTGTLHDSTERKDRIKKYISGEKEEVTEFLAKETPEEKEARHKAILSDGWIRGTGQGADENYSKEGIEINYGGNDDWLVVDNSGSGKHKWVDDWKEALHIGNLYIKEE